MHRAGFVPVVETGTATDGGFTLFICRQRGYSWGVSAEQYRYAVSASIVTLSDQIGWLSDQIGFFRPIAAALGVSTETVRRDWRLARSWLRRKLSGEQNDGAWAEGTDRTALSRGAR